MTSSYSFERDGITKRVLTIASPDIGMVLMCIKCNETLELTQEALDNERYESVSKWLKRHWHKK